MKRKEVSISSIPLIYVKRQQEHANGGVIPKRIKAFFVEDVVNKMNNLRKIKLIQKQILVMY